MKTLAREAAAALGFRLRAGGSFEAIIQRPAEDLVERVASGS